MSYVGTFVGVGDGIHDAQGEAYTIPLENESNILRLENFKSTNGPDLYVYLSTDDKATEFINLGQLKANKGNQNYNIPDNVDLNKYNNVLIWCKAFSVLFGSAELTSK
ncbi:MAG: DM13 domain-containing protein [Nitrosopumilus sp.]|nr:DM13 domain-containing protein [Nitrosopumilus sp.]